MYNRVVWAKTYMKKAGLLSDVRRGFFQITERGESVLAKKPGRIDIKYLNQFDEFKTFHALRHEKDSSGADDDAKEDRLGLDAIYIQAKRWQGSVGRPEIQKFAGALLGQKANKGVFITTGTFSKEAAEYAKTVNQKIVLIDGQKLASLMIEHNVGISVVRTYEIKRIDSDYFEE